MFRAVAPVLLRKGRAFREADVGPVQDVRALAVPPTAKSRAVPSARGGGRVGWPGNVQVRGVLSLGYLPPHVICSISQELYAVNSGGYILDGRGTYSEREEERALDVG